MARCETARKRTSRMGLRRSMGVYGPFRQYGGGTPIDWVEDFSDGLAAVGVDGKRDAQGNVTTMDGGKWGFIDQKGNTVIRPQFDEVKPFSSGVAAVWSQKNGKF